MNHTGSVKARHTDISYETSIFMTCNKGFQLKCIMTLSLNAMFYILVTEWLKMYIFFGLFFIAQTQTDWHVYCLCRRPLLTVIF